MWWGLLVTELGIALFASLRGLEQSDRTGAARSNRIAFRHDLVTVSRTPLFPPMNATLALLCFAAVAAVMTWSLIWVGRDAARRGRSAVRITLWCLILWPLGFLIWRGLRPPTIEVE